MLGRASHENADQGGEKGEGDRWCGSIVADEVAFLHLGHELRDRENMGVPVLGSRLPYCRDPDLLSQLGYFQGSVDVLARDTRKEGARRCVLVERDGGEDLDDLGCVAPRALAQHLVLAVEVHVEAPIGDACRLRDIGDLRLRGPHPRELRHGGQVDALPGLLALQRAGRGACFGPCLRSCGHLVLALERTRGRLGGLQPIESQPKSQDDKNH